MTPETRAALALVAAGIPVTAVDRTMRLLDVGVADNEDTIGTKIAELRTDLPGLFSESAPAGSVDGRTAKERARDRFDGPRPGETDYQAGQRLARERYPQLAQPGG